MPTPNTKTRSQPGFIYILRPRALVGGCEVIKIGMTTRPVEERVRELTTGSVVGLEILYSLYVDDARELERQLHDEYRAHRSGGGGQEFFAVAPQEVIARIERIAIEVSSQRAWEERNSELAVFMREIGAAQLEALLRLSGKFLLIPVGIVGVWIWFKFVGFWTVFFAPLMFLLIGSMFLRYTHALFRSWFFEPKFAALISAKNEELQRKYPLTAKDPGGVEHRPSVKSVVATPTVAPVVATPPVASIVDAPTLAVRKPRRIAQE